MPTRIFILTKNNCISCSYIHYCCSAPDAADHPQTITMSSGVKPCLPLGVQFTVWYLNEFANSISGMSTLVDKRSSTAHPPPFLFFLERNKFILRPRSDSSFELESCVEHIRCYLSYRWPISESLTSSVLDSPKLRLHFLGRLREFLS